MFRQRPGPRIYTTKDIQIYPLLDRPVVFSSAATAWTWGGWIEVIPPNTITADFLIAGILITIGNPDVAREFDIQIGVGVAGQETPIITWSGSHVYWSTSGAISFFTTTAFSIPRKVPANSRIAVRAADSIATPLRYRCKIQFIKLPAV